MMSIGRRALIVFCSVLVCATGAPARVQPQGGSRVTEILVDASNGKVLFARSPDALRRPASLTKMMTLYLAFDAIKAGRLRTGDMIRISARAARQPASRLGVRSGSTIEVRQAVRAIAVSSANDVAVALGEKLGGTEDRFARLMTAKAHQLGLRHTRFANATGLTNPGNVTTARDMATLSMALLRDHPRDYAVFATRSVQWQKRRIANHNHLLGRVPGVDGIKTGYTVDAGYNLAASSRRKGRRLVAVVLGEKSVVDRDVRVSNLLQLGAEQPRARPGKAARVAAASSGKRLARR
jgi:D-alanyl-D-alanine carboxypeptidase